MIKKKKTKQFIDNVLENPKLAKSFPLYEGFDPKISEYFELTS